MGHESLDNILALGTIALQILTIVFIVVYFLRGKYPDLAEIGNSIGKWGTRISFLVATAGSALTLVYSDIFGIPPCVLCWWQRVFLYPQVILFGLSLWKREVEVTLFAMIFSALGFFVAMYHHALQMFPASLPCPSQGVSCAQIFFLEYGYITYPMMAASTFAFIFVLMLFVRAKK